MVGVTHFDDGRIPQVEAFALETSFAKGEAHLGFERIVRRFCGVGLEGFIRCACLKSGGDGGAENEARQREGG